MLIQKDQSPRSKFTRQPLSFRSGRRRPPPCDAVLARLTRSGEMHMCADACTCACTCAFTAQRSRSHTTHPPRAGTPARRSASPRWPGRPRARPDDAGCTDRRGYRAHRVHPERENACGGGPRTGNAYTRARHIGAHRACGPGREAAVSRRGAAHRTASASGWRSNDPTLSACFLIVTSIRNTRTECALR